MPIPWCIHVFIFPHVLGSSGMFFITHPSFMWSSQETEPSWVFILHVFRFSASCMPSPSSSSHRNIVVHSNHSLFHSVHVCCVFIMLAELCFILGCSPVVTILSRAKVRGLLFVERMSSDSTRFYEKEWSSMVSSVLLRNGLLYDRVSGSLFFFCWPCGLLCVHIFP